MSKKQRIDSKLNTNNTKSNIIELHVLVANRLSWKPENWQAWDRGNSISIGFVKADPNVTLFDLRSKLIQQLRPETLPDQYIYLRHVGRGSTICSARQERTLMARDFAPPFYPHAELCILSSEDMVFHTRYAIVQGGVFSHSPSRTSRYRRNQNMVPAIVTSDLSPHQSMSAIPPVTPTFNRLNGNYNNTAPTLGALDRSKSPSFRSLQSLEGAHFVQNNDLMMAEINFLEAKKALADAHAAALRNQMMVSNSIVIENGMDSELGSEDAKMLEEDEQRRKEEEEEERKREEEERRREEEAERERIRAEEEERRQRLLAEEEERRREQEENEREQQRRQRERQEKEEAEKRRRREKEEKERRIEEEIRRAEEEALAKLRKKQEAMYRAEQERIAELERVAKEEEEKERRRREEAEQKKDAEKEAAKRINEEGGDSDDEEADRAMKLIDDLTMTPRPWQAVKDPNKKKIVRVPREYSKEQLEEMMYLRSKIKTYRDHRKIMETKHHDLLARLADMEEHWNDDEHNKGFESKWRPKCKQEEARTPQLYERNRQLRLELQMLYKQADTIITRVQAKNTHDSRKGMAFPSIKNNLRINLQKIQHEVEELRKRAATAQIKYEAERSNREGVEKEVKQLRQELINSKISSNLR